MAVQIASPSSVRAHGRSALVERILPLLRLLLSYARVELRAREALGDIPPGEYSPEDIVDEALLRAIEHADEAPEDRLYPWLRRFVRQAIERELEREGQIYYVHNRISSIYHIAEKLRKLVPHVRIGIGHGQMPDEELEQVMLDFMHHRTDVLLATTIIENGLDLPNVNTLIVDRAELLGLSQMYQLRGRVGRSTRQAYSYFFSGSRGKLREEAEEIGFLGVMSGPLVRSSYRAGRLYQQAVAARA